MLTQKILKNVNETVLIRQGENTILEDIRIESLGQFEWLNIDERRIITLQDWKNEMHFCPFKRSKSKWILTCRTHLDKVVHQLSGKDIGKSISLKKENLVEFMWHHNSGIACPEDQYVITCHYYWHKALDTMRDQFFERLANAQLTPAASFFCHDR